MAIQLARDRAGVPFQAAGLGNVIASDFGATATTATGVVNSNIVRMFATAYVHFNFSGVAAATTDTLLPADRPEIFAIPPGTTVNMIAQAGGAGVLGTLFITES